MPIVRTGQFGPKSRGQFPAEQVVSLNRNGVVNFSEISNEATNSLDTENEKIIVENINKLFKGRTMIIVVHRLSTVKNADQIIVFDNGRIIEIGPHFDLIKNEGVYYQLVKNQLELNN